MSPHTQEPTISRKFHRLLAALWISAGLHGALLALVKVAPGTATTEGLIEVRLASSTQQIQMPRLTPRVDASVIPVEPTLVPSAKPAAADTLDSSSRGVQHTTLPLPRMEIPLSVDLNYYTARELDQTPQGSIPEPKILGVLPGKIRLRAKIEVDGRVSDVEVIESQPPGLYDEAALAAFWNAHFSSAIKDNRPVRALVIYELTINDGRDFGSSR